MKTIPWYKEWFDSPYYHLLYRHRNYKEAYKFTDALVNDLQIANGARILDLACGRGRYALHLAHMGFDLTGIDLSERSIKYAIEFEQEHLSFYQHDMKSPFRINYFDYIFNFFTSFGYFDRPKDDLRTLKSVNLGLKKNGIFVLDYFNSNYIINNLVDETYLRLDGIYFTIDKYIQDNRIIKSIVFQDKHGIAQQFKEKVRLYLLEDFQKMLNQVNLGIIKTYGDYSLNDFDVENSPRLILVAKKNEHNTFI